MTNQQSETLQAALKYASWGWQVVPLLPDSKAPTHDSNGVNSASSDPETINSWFDANPEINIGIAAGKQSGIIVFDIDPRNGGEESWDEWQSEHGKIPDGAMQLTAGGGEHYIAEYDERFRSSKLSPGIDLLSDGRYFVASPSTINGKRYEWEGSSDPEDGVAPICIPESWATAYQERNNKRRSTKAPDSVIQGDRNNALTALGGSLRYIGMGQDEIYAALIAANDTRCDPPMPQSEVFQIARSVVRYEADQDVAASVGLGSEAANAILAGIEQAKSDYFFTTGTALMSQPAPLEWSIEDWLPAQGAWMIYGQSGVGKSFVALDMACSIATGHTWHGHEVEPGYTIYLAGEGNYGMRSRIASWAKHHCVSRIDKLIVSNRPIDLDAPNVAAQIMDAINELLPEGATVSMIVVDTLNNHMSGDENSAQDTRALLNCIGSIARAYETNAGIVHHTGNSDAAQHRGRGSSAIKAALDSQILISTEGDDLIKIQCTKMKDGKEPDPVFGELQEINLGWYDTKGKAQPGAVFQSVDHHETEPDPNHKYKHEFKSAWIDTACKAEDNQGRPNVSTASLQRWYEEKQGVQPGTAKKYAAAKNKAHSRVLPLLSEGWLIEYQHGYSITKPDESIEIIKSNNNGKS